MMVEAKTWLEVALNGSVAAGCPPGAPVNVDEIVAQGIACVQAGAAIVQVQAYDAGGAPTDDAGTYVRIIEGIRSRVDAIVYPCGPVGAGRGAGGEPARQWAYVEELARLGLIEWLAVSPGSANLSHYDDLREDRAGALSCNAEPDIRRSLQLARRHGLNPSYAILEAGFIRLGATLHWRESCPAPIYRFVFAGGYTTSFPPEDYGLTAYLKLMDQVAPGAQWMVSGLHADVFPLVPRVVAEGGHVRVGIADAVPDGSLGNLQLVEQAANLVKGAGGDLAAPRDVRAALSPEDPPTT